MRLPANLGPGVTEYTNRIKDAIKDGRVLVLDIETDGHAGDKLWVVGTLNVYTNCSPAMMNPAVAASEIRKMVSEGYIFVIHNAKFDVEVLGRHGITIPYSQVVDTMLLSYVRNPSRTGGHSLAALGEKMNYRQALVDGGLLDAKAKKGDEYKVPTNPIMYTYCAQDLRTTAEVFRENIQMIERDDKGWGVFWLEMQFLPIIASMERAGMVLDRKLAESQLSEWLSERESIATETQELVGLMPGKVKEYKRGYHKRGGVVTYNHCELDLFNPASNKQVASALTRLYGWEPAEHTATGQPKVDAAVLKKLSEDYPLAGMLTKISKLDKLSGMVASYLEQVTTTNRLHGSFNQALTVTGRLSSSHPNLQNVPTRGEDGAMVRSMFTCPPGYKVVGNDLSNIEGRVLAHLLSAVMGEHRLADTFKAGKDFHQANADAWGVERSDAKILLYSSLYGAGPLTVGKGDSAWGQQLLDTLDKNMPAITGLKRYVWNKCRKSNGLIHTWFGRRLWYRDICSRDKGLRSRAERQVFNAVLQGTAADILKMITIMVEREVTPHYDAVLVAQVHDEGQWHVREEQAEQFALDIEPHFSYDYLSHCPTEGQAKIGNNWNEVH